MTLTLGQMPNQQAADAGSEHGPSQSQPRLGLSLAPASDNKGVEVTAVDPNGPAAERGIRAGDVIMNVAGAAVSSPTDVQTKLSEVRQAGKHSVLMRVKSGEQVRYVALPLATG